MIEQTAFEINNIIIVPLVALNDKLVNLYCDGKKEITLNELYVTIESIKMEAVSKMIITYVLNSCPINIMGGDLNVVIRYLNSCAMEFIEECKKVVK